jgi:transcriptional regulator with XRE-family HTH domain
MEIDRVSIGKLIKQRRIYIPMTLLELSVKIGVSQTHLWRIEKGERFPSAQVIQKLAEPLGFEENELLVLAGLLSKPDLKEGEVGKNSFSAHRLDPLVAQTLACESVEVQRAVIGILSLLKHISHSEFNARMGNSNPDVDFLSK